jgi:ring-1,2-phenylacetyl-CoA epoxidase subunit PaaD
VVTAERVWEALAEIPDPEIPTISIVDLGVVRDVAIENGTVRVEFTPTFLGCPALEVMRDQMAERIRELGAEPEVQVILDDSWSTDRITPEGREKLRPALATPGRGPAARPAPEQGVPLPVLQLHRNEAREHLRPHPVPVAALLRELPPAVRAVQDHLTR